MKVENPGRRAPRIHGELLQLGFKVSEPTISRYLKQLKRRRDEVNAKRWLAVLNHPGEVIAAFDFFTVPTLTFKHCTVSLSSNMGGDAFFIQLHGTFDFRVDRATTKARLSRFPAPYRYVLFDHDAKFGNDAFEFL